LSSSFFKPPSILSLNLLGDKENILLLAMLVLFKLVMATSLMGGEVVPSENNQCPAHRLAVYKLQLDTFWSEQVFPKQYPQWRPPAQWSKSVGYSHQEPFSLFSLGTLVDEGVRQFVETGSSEVLDQSSSNRTFLDAILAPPIVQGVGNTSTNVFVDGNHSMISVITKIVPSPDWFIGLDSLNLCQEGRFIQSFNTEAFPLDAGTDNGFTFTSPNWETEPRAEVFQISNSFPAHPAGSFHYPSLSRLPMLAQYSVVKLREYELEREFPSERENKVKSGASKYNNGLDDQKYKYNIGLDDSGLSNEVVEFVPLIVPEKKKQKSVAHPEKSVSHHMSNEIPLLPVSNRRIDFGKSSPSKGFRGSSSTRGYHASTSQKDFLKKRYNSPLLSKATSRIYSKERDDFSKAALYKTILDSYRKSNSHEESSLRTNKVLGKGLYSKSGAKRRLRKSRRSKRPRNCHVSSWGEWGPCSKSCGIGESVRKRTVVQTARHGGSPCPKLIDFRWCGSARNACKSGYFRW